MTRITVLLAEDHRLVREGFRSLLAHEPDIEVVGEAATGREAVQLTSQLRPAVVVMDIAMPLLNGLEATRQIHKSFPETKVVVLSAHGDDAYIDQATLLGAAGFLLKETSSDVLADAIREVQKGNTFFCPSIYKSLRDRSQKSRNGITLQKENQPPEFSRGGGAPTRGRGHAQQESRRGTRLEF
jgi:DNA-binding NarL/FixJ family response regulator